MTYYRENLAAHRAACVSFLSNPHI